MGDEGTETAEAIRGEMRSALDGWEERTVGDALAASFMDLSEAPDYSDEGAAPDIDRPEPDDEDRGEGQNIRRWEAARALFLVDALGEKEELDDRAGRVSTLDGAREMLWSEEDSDGEGQSIVKGIAGGTGRTLQNVAGRGETVEAALENVPEAYEKYQPAEGADEDLHGQVQKLGDEMVHTIIHNEEKREDQGPDIG